MDDHHLLRQFNATRSQDAFRQLMERHLPMVYSVACRMVSDPDLAQDVTQKVFLSLVNKAGSIQPPQVIGGWLYNTTRHTAMHIIRSEQRRREREHTAALMQSMNAGDESVRILEQLEPAMAELEAVDRDALVLRYLEGRSLREVGQELGVSEDAARMRVNRAEERLKGIFARQGIGVSSVLLASVLGASTATVVPAGLSAALCASVFSSAAGPVTIAAMNWINLKTIGTVITAMALTGAGTYLVQDRQADQLRRERGRLVAENQALQAQLAELETEAQAADQKSALERQNMSELLRLRNEIGQLRQQLAASREAQESVRTPLAATGSSAPRKEYQFNREKLSHSGYESPEAALQTAAWAVVYGGEKEILETLSAELLADEEAGRIYRRNQKAIAPVLKGIKMLSKKPISDAEVEIKVEYEVGMGNGPTLQMFAVTPMLKGTEGWKLGITKDYSPAWESTGQIENLSSE